MVSGGPDDPEWATDEFEFAGWFTLQGERKQQWNHFTENTTLYAHWRSRDPDTVTANINVEGYAFALIYKG